jgi:DNA-binding SARP family transcriptional activator
MHAHTQQGHRRQALAAYERCVRTLRAQLDMAPLPETTQAYEQMRRDLGEQGDRETGR